MTENNEKKITFGEYEEFIYLNTTLPRMDARLIARECWNKGLDKYEALREAKKLYTTEQ